MTTTTDFLTPHVPAQLQEIVADIDKPAFLVEIPDPAVVDLRVEDVASLVARTSNTFGRLARFAGLAKGEAKIAKARYERKFKLGKLGSNEAEREANGLKNAVVEHEALAAIEAISEHADGLCDAARVASESARKLLDAMRNQHMASVREAAGTMASTDFRPY